MRILYAALAGVVLGLACNVTAQTVTFGSFNGVATPIQSAPSDSIVQVTAEAQGLQLVSPADVPMVGTFWLVTSNGMPVPMPFPPMDANQPIYAITDTAFLVDGTGGQVTTSPLLNSQMTTTASVTASMDSLANTVVDLINQVQGNEIDQQMQMMSVAMGVPLPPGGDSGTNSYTPYGASFSIPNYSTNLWIAQLNLASGYLNGIGTNTVADVPYEIQTRTNHVLQPDWRS